MRNRLSRPGFATHVHATDDFRMHTPVATVQRVKLPYGNYRWPIKG